MSKSRLDSEKKKTLKRRKSVQIFISLFLNMSLMTFGPKGKERELQKYTNNIRINAPTKKGQ